MKSGPFTFVVSTVLRMDPKTMTVFARNLKEATPPLVSTGARGVNAPEMSPSDMAALLLAVLATDKPARAVEMVNRFKDFQLSANARAEAVSSMLPDRNHTLLDFMTVVCDPATKLDPHFEFTIRAIGSALVEIKGGKWTLIYSARQELDHLSDSFAKAEANTLPPDLEAQLIDGPNSLHGLVTSRELRSTTIEFIKKIVFERNLGEGA